MRRKIEVFPELISAPVNLLNKKILKSKSNKDQDKPKDISLVPFKLNIFKASLFNDPFLNFLVIKYNTTLLELEKGKIIERILSLRFKISDLV